MLARYRYRSIVATSDSQDALGEFRRAIEGSGGPPVVTTGALVVGDLMKKRNEELRRRNGAGSKVDFIFDHYESWDAGEKPDVWQIHLDFLADLHLMADCDGLVGKFTSNVDRIVLALMAVRRRCLPPYISIDESRWCFDTGWPWVGRSALGRFQC